MAVNALSDRHRIAADIGVFPKFDAAAYGYRVAAHRSVHHNIAENGNRIAARSGHVDGAKDTDRVADVFVSAHGDALKKLHAIAVGFRECCAGDKHN
jgi:hypothetical protein